MYNLINDNIELLLNGISKKDHLDPYISLCKSFEERRNNSTDFKSTYRKFYQLNAARLSNDFCESYFSLLEKNRSNKKIDIQSIVNSLYEIESNSKGTHAVHFSFASKLIHTVNNDFPLYDSMVASFYFFPDIKPYWDKDRKIREYLNNYHFLVTEYRRVIENELMKPAMDTFREYFSVGIEYSDVKVIDTLLWRYTALLKSGAIRNGNIQYG